MATIPDRKVPCATHRVYDEDCVRCRHRHAATVRDQRRRYDDDIREQYDAGLDTWPEGAGR